MIRENQRPLNFTDSQVQQLAQNNHRLRKLNRAAVVALRGIGHKVLTDTEYRDAGNSFATTADQIMFALRVRRELLTTGREQQPDVIQIIYKDACDDGPGPRSELPTKPDDLVADSREAAADAQEGRIQLRPMFVVLQNKAKTSFSFNSSVARIGKTKPNGWGPEGWRNRPSSRNASKHGEPSAKAMSPTKPQRYSSWHRENAANFAVSGVRSHIVYRRPPDRRDLSTFRLLLPNLHEEWRSRLLTFAVCSPSISVCTTLSIFHWIRSLPSGLQPMRLSSSALVLERRMVPSPKFVQPGCTATPNRIPNPIMIA